MTNVYEDEKINREHRSDVIKAPYIGELKMTNNPCKYCNQDILPSEPLCGDIDSGETAYIKLDEDGYKIKYFAKVGLAYFIKINYCPMCGRKLTEE